MGQSAIIGLDELGVIITTTLSKSGFDVLAIDKDINRVEEIKEHVTRAIQLDPTDEDSLIELNIKDVDTVVVNLGDDFESAVLTVAILKKLGVKEIIATAENEIKGRILSLSGAVKIIYPQKEIGLKIAKSLMAPRLIDIISLSIDHSLSQIKVPSKFIGKKLSEIHLRKNYRLNLVGIKKIKIDPKTNEEVEQTNYLPMGDDMLQKDDILIIIGLDDDIENISLLE